MYSMQLVTRTHVQDDYQFLHTAKKSLEDIRRIYFRLKEQVLKGKGILAHYLGFCDSRKLEELLIEIFGRDMRMTDELHPK